MSRSPMRPFPASIAQPGLELEVAYCVGGVISPLLANLYMRRFVLGWKKLGYESRLRARVVSYADDLVICCRVGVERPRWRPCGP